LNAYWREAVTDTTPYHPYYCPISFHIPGGYLWEPPIPSPFPEGAEGWEAMGAGQAFKMLNGQKQAILSRGLNLS